MKDNHNFLKKIMYHNFMHICTINICIIRNVNIFLSIGFDIFLGAQKKCLIERVPTPYDLF